MHCVAKPAMSPPLAPHVGGDSQLNRCAHGFPTAHAWNDGLCRPAGHSKYRRATGRSVVWPRANCQAKSGRIAVACRASVTAGPRWHSLVSSNGKWKLRGLTSSETSQPPFAAILTGDPAKLAPPFLSLHSSRQAAGLMHCAGGGCLVRRRLAQTCICQFCCQAHGGGASV